MEIKDSVSGNIQQNCGDIKCPFHGTLSTRGREFLGTVTSAKMKKTAVVEWEWKKYIRKYERYEKKGSKVHAHNPICIEAREGDTVRISECMPLSKSKKFVIIEKMGMAKGFKEKMQARVEARKKETKQEQTSDIADKNAAGKS